MTVAMVTLASTDVHAVVTDGYNMNLVVEIAFTLFIMFLVVLAVFAVAKDRQNHTERLDTLQTCIEFDNPVEWCIEQFRG